MEYRKLPKGNERISILGMGTSSIGAAGEKEAREVMAMALEQGINYFDLASADAVPFSAFGQEIGGCRKDVYFQIHFGADYHTGTYGWTTNLESIRRSIDWQLNALKTDYIDFGFLHCIDAESDLQKVQENGVLEWIKELKKQGVVRHIGFSSHTPSVANRVLDTGVIDMMMFSINPAYDLEQGDELGIGSTSERAALFCRCESMGVGISVMKPFHGGKLLDEKTSPFHTAMTRFQCIQYALDRPGVLAVVPGVRDLKDLNALLGFADAPEAEKDYSVIGEFTPQAAQGNCVYCNHCQPCPAGIDVGLVNKYYDLALAGDHMAANHYEKLAVKADACIGCGHCDRRCPFHTRQSARMKEIEAYFGK